MSWVLAYIAGWLVTGALIINAADDPDWSEATFLLVCSVIWPLVALGWLAARIARWRR